MAHTKAGLPEFVDAARARENLDRIARALPELDIEFIVQLASTTPDPDLALDALERAISRRIPDGLQVFADAGRLQKIVALAGRCARLLEMLVPELEALPATHRELESIPSPFLGETASDLRIWHHCELAEVASTTLDESSDVESIAETLSRLADATVTHALELADESGECRGGFGIVALGKWGGMELNFSSDIDLYFLRASDIDAQTAERVARRILKILQGEQGAHLYRTDLRLRPGGPAGSLVPTAAQARKELALVAGVWERIVSIRARLAVEAGPEVESFLADLEKFVYEAPFRARDIRQLKDYKSQLEKTLEGRDTEKSQIKVGWGGIRDVEYVVQFLQILHGRTHPSIRGGNVFRSILNLGRIGALTLTEGAYLLDGYRFLRRLEHELMLRHRLPKFVLPKDEIDRRALHRAIHHDSWTTLERTFQQRRKRIRGILEQLFHRPFSHGEASEEDAEVDLILAFVPDPVTIDRVFGRLGFRDPKKAHHLLRRLAFPRRKKLRSPRARQFYSHLFPRLLAHVKRSPDPDQAVLTFANCVETLGAPATFYQLLSESPHYVGLFVDLFGSSPFVSELLLNHPVILDELIDRLRTGRRIVARGLFEELEQSVYGRVRERQIGKLHEFRALHTVEVALLDIAETITTLGVVDRLSAIARALVRTVDGLVTEETRDRCGVFEDGSPRHVILALGRLGGNELGYASDLDMILLYEGEGRSTRGYGPAEVYTQHLQRVIAMLQNPGLGGALYPVDLRLRPRGQGGMLVHSFREFRSYLESSESESWEHQALVRCSPLAGDMELGDEVLQAIHRTIGRTLDPDVMLRELAAMHRRRRQKSRSQEVMLKHGPGGILDIEFLVQTAMLLAVREDSENWEPNTYQALERLTQLGYFSHQECASLGSAYLFFRLVENRLSMIHRSSVRAVRTDDDSLGELALRIGYLQGSGNPEQLLLQELNYHTGSVLEILEAHAKRGGFDRELVQSPPTRPRQ